MMIRWIALLGIGLALALVLDLLPFLRGGFGWQWPYELAPLLRVLPLVLAVIGYLAGAWYLQKRRGLVLWCILAAALIPVVALLARSDDALYTLFERTVSGVVTGPHMAAAEIDWQDPASLDWPHTVEQFEGRSIHVVLAPPGLPLVHHGVNSLFALSPGVSETLQRGLMSYQCHNYRLLEYDSSAWAGAWLGMLMPLWAALACLPLFSLTRRLYNANAARLAVTWWPLVPALVLFVPTWNTFYPLVALSAMWLLVRGMEPDASPLWHIGAGLLVGLLTFANFSLVPLVALLGFYALLTGLQTEQGAQRILRPVIVGLWFAVGLALPWLIFWLVSGLTPFELLAGAMAEHLTLDRPYLPWLWLHFWEWALFTGLPLILLWLVGAWRGNRLALALALTMLILLLSGTARGETGRVWLFYAPFVMVAAAPVLSGRRDWLLIGMSQAAILVALVAAWPVVTAPEMTAPPSAPGPLAAERTADAAFGDAFRLVGWDAEVGNDAITLYLNWESQVQMTMPYWFSALLVGPDGAPVGESVDWQPLQTRYPTTCWGPGEIVGDSIMLPLPADAPAGAWWISLAAFANEAAPDDRLTVTLPDGSRDAQIGLGPVTVP